MPAQRRLSPGMRLLVVASVPLALIGVGTLGFHLIEPLSWFEAFYQTAATLSSIGSGTHSLSTRGRLFTVLLALGGIATFALAATEILRAVITGELRQHLEKHRMEKRIDHLRQHVIVCGYGRVGRYTCADLLGAGIPFVVIDRNEATLAAAREAGAHPVWGDAAVDATLRQAGIERARALVAAAGTDPENLLITMTARLLHPTLPIIARVAEEATAPKLVRAGATRTISPYAIGGGRMAQAILRPAVLDFVEVATRHPLPDVQVEQRLVQPGSPLAGKTIGESGLRSRLGLILVAVRRPDGAITFNPEDEAALAPGDTLIVLGRRAQLLSADALIVPAPA